MKEETRKMKLLQLSENCIVTLTKEAAKRNKLFKPFAESILEEAAFKKTTDTLEERKESLKEKLRPFIGTYPKGMVIKFFNYWSEHSEKGKRMRFEKEKVFDVKKRLEYWKNNEFNGKSNGKQSAADAKRESVTEMGNLARKVLGED